MRPAALLAALALALSLSGCGGSGDSSGVLLYFCADPARGTPHGPAIRSQPYQGSGGAGVEELVDALLSGPTQGGLTSPFPEGLTLQGWSLEDGLLTLSLSEQYGGLADVSLTLADYCLVLTLSQVDGVDAVQIQSAGHTYHSRSHQTMQAEEAILDQEALSAPGD